MMKKIICLLLGLLMVASILTSCSDTGDVVDNINDEASRLTTTLNLWVITESPVIASVSDLAIQGLDPEKDEEKLSDAEKAQLAALSEEQKQALTQLLRINQAVNKITKAKFKTKLNIKYSTEAEYYTQLEKGFRDHEKAIEDAKAAAKAEREAIKRGEAVAKPEEVQTDETVINEHGIPELKYPTAEGYQIDVLFVGNFGKYRDYIDKDWILPLDLENSAMQISNYVNQIFLNGVTYNGVRYAVPNNTTIGEYTYVCVKTSEIESFGYTLADLQNRSIYDQNYYDLFTQLSDKYGTFLYAPDGIDLQSVHYWNFDTANGYALNPETFSIFGGTFDNVNSTNSTLTKRGDQVIFANLLNNPSYMKNYLARKAEYEESYVTSDASAVVCVEKGGWELKEQYEKNGYSVLVMENPRANDETVYSSMFAMGAYTKDEARAMEIITCLNTDQEFRNLLQYGVENVNYTLSTLTVTDENGVKTDYPYVVETENNLYKMDVNKTGNVFLAYPTSAETVFEWEYGKQQNLEASTYPTLGLFFDLENYKIDTKSICIINAVSARIDAYLDTLTTSAEIVACYDEASNARNSTQMAAFLLSKTNNDMTYTEGGVAKTFTQAELAAALDCMANKMLSSNENALQSPNALYNNWVANSGVRETTTK